MSSDYILRATGLSKVYELNPEPQGWLKRVLSLGSRQKGEDFWAVKDVSFEIRKGETIGIIGRNGSGKSTLLHMVCSLLNPTQGDIVLNGRMAPLLELGAGFDLEFTGIENIYLKGSILGFSRKEIEAMIPAILEFSEIEDFIHQPVKTYSSGMFVRLAFAIAIHVEPDILVIDEALAVGDMRFQKKCIRKIKSISEKAGMLITSHDMGLILRLCNRVLWLERGQLQMAGSPKKVAEAYIKFMLETNHSKTSEKSKSERSAVQGINLNKFLPIDSGFQQHGEQKVSILSVRFHPASGSPTEIHAGESFQLNILVQAHEDVANPIAGFLIKDGWGNDILGDNTALLGEPLEPFLKEKRYLVTFFIKQWPNFASAGYSLSVGVSEGTLENHTVNHWVQDAWVIEGIQARKPGALMSIIDTSVLSVESVEMDVTYAS